MRKTKPGKVIKAIEALEGMGKIIALEAAHLKALVNEHPEEATQDLLAKTLEVLDELADLHNRLAVVRVGVSRKYEDNSAEALRELL